MSSLDLAKCGVIWSDLLFWSHEDFNAISKPLQQLKILASSAVFNMVQGVKMVVTWRRWPRVKTESRACTNKFGRPFQFQPQIPPFGRAFVCRTISVSAIAEDESPTYKKCSSANKKGTATPNSKCVRTRWMSTRLQCKVGRQTELQTLRCCIFDMEMVETKEELELLRKISNSEPTGSRA